MNTSRYMYCGNSHETHENHSPYYTPQTCARAVACVFQNVLPYSKLRNVFTLVLYGVPSLIMLSGIPYLVAFLEIMVRVGNFVNKCKCAIRVETKSKTTTLWTHEKWRPKCDVLCNIGKMICFVFFAQNGKKNREMVVLLLILPYNFANFQVLRSI